MNLDAPFGLANAPNCGPFNNPLPPRNRTDQCCLDHDYCYDQLNRNAGFKRKFRTYFYHNRCDDNLLECLKGVPGFDASFVRGVFSFKKRKMNNDLPKFGVADDAMDDLPEVFDMDVDREVQPMDDDSFGEEYQYDPKNPPPELPHSQLVKYDRVDLSVEGARKRQKLMDAEIRAEMRKEFEEFVRKARADGRQRLMPSELRRKRPGRARQVQFPVGTYGRHAYRGWPRRARFGRRRFFRRGRYGYKFRRPFFRRYRRWY